VYAPDLGLGHYPEAVKAAISLARVVSMNSQIINVAIVLIGIYIALAVACSWLQEQIAALFKLRAGTLRKGIKELISRDVDVFKQISEHPLITSASSEGKLQFSSYVDARNFTLAFWQSVGPTVDSMAASPLGQAIADPKVTFTSVIDAVNSWTPTTDSAKGVKLSAIALLNSAEGDYDKLLKATDTWFNAQMDRVSGWYKRTAQYFLIGIAVVVAFVAGVDTIDIGRQLSAAPAISEATAQSISSVAKKPGAGINDVGKAIKDAQGLQNLQLLRPCWLSPRLRAPWCSSKPASAGVVPEPEPVESFFGILITAIAVSLGAPFWFDLLKGLVNVRMAGERPVDTPPPATPSPSK
jgi:hypothetical protein